MNPLTSKNQVKQTYYTLKYEWIKYGIFNKIQYKLSFFPTLQKNALFKMLLNYYLPALLLLYLSRFLSNALTLASAAENAALRSRSSFNLPAEFLFQCLDARISSRECCASFQILLLFYLLSFLSNALTCASAAESAALRSRFSFYSTC
jgi:hypothetical protein